MSQEQPKVLILGASGGVGGMIFRNLAATERYHLTGTYYGSPKPELIPCDISNRKSLEGVIDKSTPDIILDFAGLSQEGICRERPKQARETNIGGIQNIVEIVSKTNTPLLFPGTVNEFSGYTNGTICTEDTPLLPKPDSVYGETKVAASKIITQSCTSTWSILRSDLVLGSEFGIVGLFEKNQFAQIKIDATRFPVYLNDYLQSVRNFIDNPSQNSGLYHLVSSEFKNGILLSDLAKIIINKFNLAPDYKVITQNTEISPRLNLDDPMPIYIHPEAKKLAVENRIFASTRR